MGGQFAPATSGQFAPAQGGQFSPASGGQFDRFLQYSIDQKKPLYIIHENDEDRIKRKFKRNPIITIDEFTGKKTIKWDRGEIRSYSVDKKVAFTFSFHNIGAKDFIVFQFRSKEFMLSKNDIVSFLFSDNKIIDFIITDDSYKIGSIDKEKIFENKVLISDEELQQFEEQNFVKWRLIFKKQNREITGGNPDDYYYFSSFNNLTIDIKNFAKEYRKLVRSEIPDYTPFNRSELPTFSDNSITEECYVYLMIDLNNHYHKIGISNKPDWREKTLQSEKPTIELVAAKKFVNRKIASSFEKALHETYFDKRIRGEWFQLDTNDIEEIKTTLLS